MSESDLKTRIVGKSAIRTIIQLIIVSILVGMLFSFLGIGPRDFWNWVFHAIKDLLSAIGESFSEIVFNIGTYLIIGAAIVVPLWILTRLWSGRK